MQLCFINYDRWRELGATWRRRGSRRRRHDTARPRRARCPAVAPPDMPPAHAVADGGAAAEKGECDGMTPLESGALPANRTTSGARSPALGLDAADEGGSDAGAEVNVRLGHSASTEAAAPSECGTSAKAVPSGAASATAPAADATHDGNMRCTDSGAAPYALPPRQPPPRQPSTRQQPPSQPPPPPPPRLCAPTLRYAVPAPRYAMPPPVLVPTPMGPQLMMPRPMGPVPPPMLMHPPGVMVPMHLGHPMPGPIMPPGFIVATAPSPYTRAASGYLPPPSIQPRPAGAAPMPPMYTKPVRAMAEAPHVRAHAAAHTARLRSTAAPFVPRGGNSPAPPPAAQPPAPRRALGIADAAVALMTVVVLQRAWRRGAARRGRRADQSAEVSAEMSVTAGVAVGATPGLAAGEAASVAPGAIAWATVAASGASAGVAAVAAAAVSADAAPGGNEAAANADEWPSGYPGVPFAKARDRARSR